MKQERRLSDYLGHGEAIRAGAVGHAAGGRCCYRAAPSHWRQPYARCVKPSAG